MSRQIAPFVVGMLLGSLVVGAAKWFVRRYVFRRLPEARRR